MLLSARDYIEECQINSGLKEVNVTGRQSSTDRNRESMLGFSSCYQDGSLQDGECIQFYALPNIYYLLVHVVILTTIICYQRQIWILYILYNTCTCMSQKVSLTISENIPVMRERIYIKLTCV